MAAKRRRWGVAGTLAALSVCLASVAPAQGADDPTPPAMSPIDYTHPGQLVAVAGARRLNLRCIGAGAPTVVLDAGAGNFSYTWRFVQPAIARFTRVCSYDRAGYGFSDPNDRPATAANIVDDLHTALAKAGVSPPFVLVGQSAGGLYATLYADMYLPDVVGMVLVDPGFASQSKDDYSMALRTADELAKERKEKADVRALLRRCADLARAKTIATMKDACPCGPSSLDGPDFAAYVVQYCAGPNHYEAVLAEDAALLGVPGEGPTQSEREEAAAARPFGAMPLIVLTQSKGFPYDGERAELKAQRMIAWRAGHVVLAGRSTRGKLVMPPNSGHMIQMSQPKAVVDAVQEVVNAASDRPVRAPSLR
jgi:pimeloyl-ACP methyl ester carboxylesterase